MLKKSLFFGSIAVLAALLLITGCSNPTSSSSSSGNEEENNNNTGNNNTGGNGGNTDNTYTTVLGPDVTAQMLADAFKGTKPVLLGAGVTSVAGEIPSGKTLYITQGNPAVTPTKFLEVKGTISVEGSAVLNASYTDGVAGYLTGTGSNKIVGNGAVSLPVVTTGNVPEGAIAYSSTAIASTVVKVSGAMITTNAPGSAVAVGNIVTLFEGLEAAAPAGTKVTLTLANITELTNVWASSANRTLVLTGAGNTITAALNLESSDGTLVVEGTLAANITGAAITAKSTGNIIINGILDLQHAAGTVAGGVINNGRVKSAATTGPAQAPLLKLAGSGTVEINGGATTALTTAETVGLTQNVVIGTTGKLMAPVHATPFTGNKTITINGEGVLDFGIADAGLTATTLSGVTIVNNATTDERGITTATITASALNAILGLGGKILSIGAIGDADTTAILVPAGTDLIHKTGAIGKVGALTIQGKARFTTGEFGTQAAPVTVSTGAVTTFTEATFAAITDATQFTINGTATFTAATFAGLTGTLTIGPQANATFTAATFAGLSGLTVNGQALLGAAVAPTDDFAVSGSGTVTIGGVSGSLTITADKTLTNTGRIVLATGKALTLKTGSGTNSGITGGGTITGAETTITGTWNTTSTNTGTVVLTATENVGIAITKGDDATGLAGGEGGVITQAGGESNNNLILSVNIDLKDNGSIFLTGAGSYAAKLTLSNSSVITCGTGTDSVSSPISIGGKVATIGSDLTCTRTNASGIIGTITSGGSTNTIVPGSSESVTISKTATIEPTV
jgi:hypothetical protein